MTTHFHKSCYTSRSSGYKYRTLSTNTGDKNHRDSREDNCYDRLFKNVRREICTRVDAEFEKTEQSRNMIFLKFEKIDSKINSMIDLQENVLAMRKTLNAAEGSLADMISKVEKIEAFTDQSTQPMSHSPKRQTAEIAETEEKELYSSEIVTV